MSAIGYARVSTVEQERDGVSLDAQTEAIAAYCKLRSLALTETIRDPAVSGGTPLEERPGGALLTTLLKEGARAVVAINLDRLFRSTVDALQHIKRWTKAKVALHLINQGGASIDTTTAVGGYLMTILAGAAEMERRLIGERVKAALSFKARRGERVGQIPYGFQLAADGVHLEPEEWEQVVILRVLKLREEGASYKGIADSLNAHNVLSRGERWHKTTVVRIVRRAR